MDAKSLTAALGARPVDSVKLVGFTAMWCIKTSGLRVIYEVHDDQQRLVVFTHRETG